MGFGGYPLIYAGEKARLEHIQRDLAREREDLAAHLKDVILSENGIVRIEHFCNEIRVALEAATLEDKRRYFELLDVQAKVTLEHGEEVVYVRCKLGEQKLVHSATLP